MGRIFGWGALVLFLIFFGNVAVSAATRQQSFSNVVELLLLLGAVVLFVACILVKEAAEKERPALSVSGGNTDEDTGHL